MIYRIVREIEYQIRNPSLSAILSGFFVIRSNNYQISLAEYAYILIMSLSTKNLHDYLSFLHNAYISLRE